MKKLIKSAVLSMLAVLTLATAPLWTGATQQAVALSSCPFMPLTGLTPADPNVNDNGPVNIGVKFKVNGAPFVRGVTFYKGVDNTGTHVAHLRKVGDSTDLASATFSGETASGWQTVNFSSDVQLPDSGPTETYVVWVSMPNGHYAYTSNMFLHNGIGNAASDVAYISQGQSSVYGYTSNDATVPTNGSYDGYFVAPIVGDSTAPGNNSGVSASDATAGPSVTWSGVGYDSNGVETAANPVETRVIRNDGTSDVTVGVQPGGYSFWRDQSGSGTQVDTTALPGASYTYTIKNVDACGNVSTGSSSSQVNTASQSLSRLFSTDPGTLDTGQTTPTVFGMHWQTSTAGKLWGVRFYRAANTAPTGTFTSFKVSLWDNDGTQLASAWVAPNNQQTGWIDVRFASPVDVSANHDYVVGYFSPNGREVYTNNVFTSAVTNGSLSARADGVGTPNGVYATGGGTNADTFPATASPNAAWYGIDVDFYVP